MCVIDGWNFALSASVTSSSLFCRTPWPLARTRATNLGCPQPGRPRSGCALGPFVPHAAHAPRKSPWTASRRLRAVFAYAPTAARCAVCLRPRAQSALRRRLAYSKRYRGAWSACVTPGQRRTPYAWSSGLLRYPGCPRTTSPSASAGGKGIPQPSPQQPPQATSDPTHGPRNRHAAAPQEAATES